MVDHVVEATDPLILLLRSGMNSTLSSLLMLLITVTQIHESVPFCSR